MKTVVLISLAVMVASCKPKLKNSNEGWISIITVTRTVSPGENLISKLDTVFSQISPDTLIINHFDYGYAMTSTKRIKLNVYENIMLADSTGKKIRFKDEDEFRNYFTHRNYRYISFERRESRSHYVFIKE